jgi:hypothetical protein
MEETSMPQEKSLALQREHLAIKYGTIFSFKEGGEAILAFLVTDPHPESRISNPLNISKTWQFTLTK